MTRAANSRSSTPISSFSRSLPTSTPASCCRRAKRNLAYSRLSRRLRVLKLNSFRDYREYLGENEAEIQNFINSISTNHTKFFREAHHFDHFREHVVKPLAQSSRKPAGANLVGGLLVRRGALHHCRRDRARCAAIVNAPRSAYARDGYRHRHSRQGGARRIRRWRGRGCARRISTSSFSAHAAPADGLWCRKSCAR